MIELHQVLPQRSCNYKKVKFFLHFSKAKGIKHLLLRFSCILKEFFSKRIIFQKSLAENEDLKSEKKRIEKRSSLATVTFCIYDACQTRSF